MEYGLPTLGSYDLSVATRYFITANDYYLLNIRRLELVSSLPCPVCTEWFYCMSDRYIMMMVICLLPFPFVSLALRAAYAACRIQKMGMGMGNWARRVNWRALR